MRRFLQTVIFGTIGFHAVLAQDSEIHRCLDKANTQSAMNHCASDEGLRVEAQLNDIYQKLLVAAREDPGAVEAIMSAQKAWIDFRDAYMDAMYPAKDKQAAYGSIFPLEFNLHRAQLTQQQIEALKELLKNYGDSKQ